MRLLDRVVALVLVRLRGHRPATRPRPAARRSVPRLRARTRPRTARRARVPGLIGGAALGRAPRPALLDRRAGADERAVHRRRGGIEHRGDLGGGEPQHVAKHEHGALAGREAMKRGEERERYRLAGLVAGLRTGRAVDDAFEQRVGIGLEPQHLAVAGGLRGGGCRPGPPSRGVYRCRAACSGSGWWRSDTARSAASSAPRMTPMLSTRRGVSPVPRPRRPAPGRGSGSSAAAARAGRGP